MARKTSAWGTYRREPIFAGQTIEQLWILGLLLAALLVFLYNLGGLPLRDWDEGIVAQVARDIWRAKPGALTWLHPTIGGMPYLNKPPLMHWLVALSYQLWGVSEWTTRLPGAILTATSVPLLYVTARELLARRTPALLAALAYLTLLPVVRHGRLAMLDGAVLCFFLLLLFCLLRTRRDLRWGLGVGIAFGLLCLTKGVVALLLVAIGLSFVFWDTPRLLSSGYVWAGVLLGSLPVVLWYGLQGLYYGEQFLNLNLVSQSLSRVWVPVENNAGPPWFYLVEIAKYSAPWLLFLPQGFRQVWDNRNLGWAKLILIWVGGYLLVISLMSTKLPWYVLPVYPALAIVVGMQLAEVWDPEDVFGARQLPRPRYPSFWTIGLALLSIAGWVGCAHFGYGPTPNAEIQILAAAIGITMTIATLLVIWGDSQFIPVLVWGMYVSLILLTMSHVWIWELNEDYPVKPVAAMVERNTPVGATVRTSHPHPRPSLNFYSDRQVVPTSPDNLDKLKEIWRQEEQPYFLVEQAAYSKLNLDSVQQLDKTLVQQPGRQQQQQQTWMLITRTARSPH
jgi:4-amino-4-deoxy-L-arabinose transferase-like glycosyltransferase